VELGVAKSWSWPRRIARANELALRDARAATLLTQYAAILGAQRRVYDRLLARGVRLTGSLERDLDELRPCVVDLFAGIASTAPAQAMRDAPTDVPEIEALLRAGWHLSDMPFLARVVLQPYVEALGALAGAGDSKSPLSYRPEGRHLETPTERAACPFCAGPPQVAVLRSDSSADGGGRSLICATCSTVWPIRRLLCPHCGEGDERRLGYFHTPEFDHVRVDACETCRCYIKTVDLTRLGLAVPVVDELAAAVLDLWAHDRGYTKVTQNLIGL
jgi:FdhE protein